MHHCGLMCKMAWWLHEPEVYCGRNLWSSSFIMTHSGTQNKIFKDLKAGLIVFNSPPNSFKCFGRWLQLKVRLVSLAEFETTMPPFHQCVHRSAHLKGNPLVHPLRTMDYEGSNIHGLTKPPQDYVPRLTIQWQSDCALTDILVNHLTMHPADCRVLFYSDSKKAMSTVDDRASGSDKG
jgi:hypothetical protein